MQQLSVFFGTTLAFAGICVAVNEDVIAGITLVVSICLAFLAEFINLNATFKKWIKATITAKKTASAVFFALCSVVFYLVIFFINQIIYKHKFITLALMAF